MLHGVHIALDRPRRPVKLTPAGTKPQNFKLRRTILVQKRNGHTHDPGIISRNQMHPRHFDCCVIIIIRIFCLMTRILPGQNQRHMPLRNIQIRIPENIAELLLRPIRPEERLRAVIPEPHPVFFQPPERVLVCNGVQAADNQKLLIVPHQYVQILPEQTERRIGNHNIRLFQQAQTSL